jgi:hypothetical protein
VGQLAIAVQDIHTDPASAGYGPSVEIAPELTGHGLPLGKCEAYNRVYDQFYQSR